MVERGLGSIVLRDPAEEGTGKNLKREENIQLRVWGEKQRAQIYPGQGKDEGKES